LGRVFHDDLLHAPLLRFGKDMSGLCQIKRHDLGTAFRYLIEARFARGFDGPDRDGRDQTTQQRALYE
jgi:hypothetical protein